MTQSMVCEASLGASGGAGVGATPGAGATLAHGLGDQVLGLLIQLLALLS